MPLIKSILQTHTKRKFGQLSNAIGGLLTRVFYEVEEKIRSKQAGPSHGNCQGFVVDSMVPNV